MIWKSVGRSSQARRGALHIYRSSPFGKLIFNINKRTNIRIESDCLGDGSPYLRALVTVTYFSMVVTVQKYIKKCLIE
jgi:hypothetical protein